MREKIPPRHCSPERSLNKTSRQFVNIYCTKKIFICTYRKDTLTLCTIDGNSETLIDKSNISIRHQRERCSRISISHLQLWELCTKQLVGSLQPFTPSDRINWDLETRINSSMDANKRFVQGKGSPLLDTSWQAPLEDGIIKIGVAHGTPSTGSRSCRFVSLTDLGKRANCPFILIGAWKFHGRRA